MSRTASVSASHEFSVQIHCPQCGQQGSETWEDSSTRGLEAQFITRSDEFYERISRKHPYPVEVVCNRCDCVLPG